jgi:hypothetical protein
MIEEEVAKKADIAVKILLEGLPSKQSLERRSHVGSAPLRPNSCSTYKKHIRGLQYFCTLIGDYESYLILLDHPPEPFCPAMNSKTIADFIRFKKGNPGDPFIPDKIGLQRTDVLGRKMVCMGGWIDPRNVDQCLSAIGALHAARGDHIGNYEKQCQQCREMPVLRDGCDIHIGKPQIWRRGNPCLTSEVKNAMKQSRLDSSGYIAQGDMALTPMELQNVRMRLLSTNKLEDLRLYTMILLSIKLFLRSDEVINLKLEDIVKDVCIVKDGGIVEALAFRVQGKSDNVPVILSLWADDSIPEFCATLYKAFISVYLFV